MGVPYTVCVCVCVQCVCVCVCVCVCAYFPIPVLRVGHASSVPEAGRGEEKRPNLAVTDCHAPVIDSRCRNPTEQGGFTPGGE